MTIGVCCWTLRKKIHSLHQPNHLLKDRQQLLTWGVSTRRRLDRRKQIRQGLMAQNRGRKQTMLVFPARPPFRPLAIPISPPLKARYCPSRILICGPTTEACLSHRQKMLTSQRYVAKCSKLRKWRFKSCLIKYFCIFRVCGGVHLKKRWKNNFSIIIHLQWNIALKQNKLELCTPNYIQHVQFHQSRESIQ